jgi:hypothetical protein
MSDHEKRFRKLVKDLHIKRNDRVGKTGHKYMEANRDYMKIRLMLRIFDRSEM